MTARHVTFVIPAYNEAKAITPVIEGALAAADEVVVVDDGSADETATVARAAGATVARHGKNLGQGAAIETGIELACRAGATHVVTFDADGQHSPGDAARMVERLDREGLDAILGTRGGKRHGMPLERFLVLKAALLFTRLTTGLKVTDTHNGLRAFTARAAVLLDLRQNRMAHASEILGRIAKLRLAYAEEQVTVRYTDYSRAKGQSSLGAIRILLDLARARVSPPGDLAETRRVREQAIEEALAGRKSAG
ncbi:MAG: glycosyltransferase family 2 protein [Deltaproteobacteria bacterium]|nr:glycosyltransferase family 2 protein [Deltaproteobacteria bacterium]